MVELAESNIERPTREAELAALDRYERGREGKNSPYWREVGGQRVCDIVAPLEDQSTIADAAVWRKRQHAEPVTREAVQAMGFTRKQPPWTAESYEKGGVVVHFAEGDPWYTFRDRSPWPEVMNLGMLEDLVILDETLPQPEKV